MPGGRDTGPWRIVAGPYELCTDRAPDLGAEWLWILRSGEQVRPVRVGVGEVAWRTRADQASPRPVWEAIASRGATLVVHMLRHAEPAGRLRIDRERVGAPSSA